MKTSTDPAWTDHEARLIRWFEATAVFFPKEQYDLSPYQRIIGPPLYYHSLRNDICQDPASPRHAGLIEELQKLHDRFKDARPD